MTTISQALLLDRIKFSIEASGWKLDYEYWRQAISQSKPPYKFILYRDDHVEKIIVYLRNLTHGGGSKRPTNEYRIQMHVEGSLLFEDGWKTIILGWWEDGGVFTGFDALKHVNPGYSSSIQIRKEALFSARENGWKIYHRGNEEIAVAFKPTLFGDYIVGVTTFHEVGKDPSEIAIAEKISEIEEPIEIIREEIQPEMTERRQVLYLINKKLRSNSFRERVLTVYSQACAFCGLQLKMVEAAHILPVYSAGSDATSNGICLCSLHHKAYDSSLITFERDYTIRINEEMIAELRAEELVGGLEQFRKNLLEVIKLPPDVRDRPNRELIEKANRIRGWQNSD